MNNTGFHDTIMKFIETGIPINSRAMYDVIEISIQKGETKIGAVAAHYQAT